jgi:hypothetical protein
MQQGKTLPIDTATTKVSRRTGAIVIIAGPFRK